MFPKRLEQAVTIAILCALTEVAAGRTQTPSIAAYWQQYFQRTVGGAAIGYSFAVMENGVLVAEGAGGTRQFRSGASPLPMLPKTRVHVASISKTITAIALLRLLEEKNLSPDAPMWPIVQQRFPGLKPGHWVDTITIAQLLAHKSGFEFTSVDPPIVNNLRPILEAGPTMQPGVHYAYSNVNYTLARILLEMLSGERYEEYVRRIVLEPAGAQGMSLHPDAADPSYIHRAGDRESTIFLRNFSEDGGAYGWYGSAIDIARVYAYLDEGRYLSDLMQKRMTQESLGIFSMDFDGGKALHHDGHWNLDDGRGSKTCAVVFPNHVVVALVMNTVWDGDIVRTVVEGYREDLPGLIQIKPVKTPAILVRATRPAYADELRCTTDTTTPGSSSPLYAGPLSAREPGIVRCAGFTGGIRVTPEIHLDIAR